MIIALHVLSQLVWNFKFGKIAYQWADMSLHLQLAVALPASASAIKFCIYQSALYDERSCTSMEYNKSHKQCDQMARLFFNIWPFTSMKIFPMAYKIFQTQASINFPRLWKFGQIGEILPNLVTLVATDLKHCREGKWKTSRCVSTGRIIELNLLLHKIATLSNDLIIHLVELLQARYLHTYLPIS